MVKLDEDRITKTFDNNVTKLLSDLELVIPTDKFTEIATTIITWSRDFENEMQDVAQELCNEAEDEGYDEGREAGYDEGHEDGMEEARDNAMYEREDRD